MTRRVFLWLLLCAALLPAQIPARDSVRHLTILHSNDIHAQALPEANGNGGLARLATAVRREREGCTACIYLNAGDLVQGTPVSTMFNGTPLYEMANLLGFDAATLGNHEFDYGSRQIASFVRIAHFPIVSANAVWPDGKPATGRAWVIVTTGGIRVAVIGAILGDLEGAHVSPAELAPLKVLPVVDTVRKYAAELRDKSDLIVVLGHLHDAPGNSHHLREVEDIIEQIPEVSVVVAGHTHVGYREMTNIDGRVAVLVNAFADQLGRLDLDVEMGTRKLKSATWRKIPVDASLPPAPDVEKLVQFWEKKVSGRVDVPIGVSTKAMERTDPELRRMIERAMAEESGADIAWIDAGNLRTGLPAGKLQARDLWNILSFENPIVVGRFNGSELPKSITDRYPVQPDREYSVAVTAFTAEDQADPNELGTTGMKFPKRGPMQRDCVIDWIRKKGTVPPTDR